MIIEKKVVSKCEQGDILASDVLNLNGVILVAKDTVLNNYIKEQLITLGIESIYIYKSEGSLNNRSNSHEIFKESYFETVMQMKNVFQDLTRGKPLDYQNVHLISKSIHDNINENDNIMKCLNEMRDSDGYTYIHSVNVAFYSMLIAKWLELSDCEIDKAIQSGLLHDVGKSQIPIEILNKKGKLTIEEYEVIKKHTLLGYDILEHIDYFDHEIKKAVLLHHERTDGSGYPFHYNIADMNLYSRIVAVADVFDAMTSERVYKKRVTPFEVIDMFQTIGISMFDTKILNTFLKNLAVYLMGSSVLLDNGQIGEIVYIPFHDMICPIIKVASEYLDLSKDNSVKIMSMI